MFGLWVHSQFGPLTNLLSPDHAPHAPGKNATNQSIQIRTYHFQKALLVNLRPLKLEGLEGYT